MACIRLPAARIETGIPCPTGESAGTSNEQQTEAVNEMSRAEGLSGGSAGNDSVHLRRCLMFGASIVLVAAAAVFAAWLIGRDSGDDSERVERVGTPWEQITAQVQQDPGRRYTDKELGLHELIDEVLDVRPSYKRFRTVDEYVAHEADRREHLAALEPGYEHDRLTFEREVQSIIETAYISLPDELGRGGQRELAFAEAMRECATAAGYPEVNPMGAPEEERSRYESEFGLTTEGLYDLRYDCAQQAASYPTLDHEVRDEMIGRMKEHYLRAIYEAIRDGSVIEVPIDPNGYDSDAHRSRSLLSTIDSGYDLRNPSLADKDLSGFTRSELWNSPRALQKLGAFRLMREVGVLELINSYVANIPRSAVYISSIEMNAIGAGNVWELESGDGTREQEIRFENSVVGAVVNGILDTLPSLEGDDRLSDEFFAALEDCARDTVGSDVDLFVIRDGLGQDPRNDESVFDALSAHDYISGLSYFEYLEVLHACARHAATYPMLEPEIRDGLLAPQHAYFARVVLEHLDNEISSGDVPARYQTEVDELRRSGW